MGKTFQPSGFDPTVQPDRDKIRHNSGDLAVDLDMS